MYFEEIVKNSSGLLSGFKYNHLKELLLNAIVQFYDFDRLKPGFLLTQFSDLYLQFFAKLNWK